MIDIHDLYTMNDIHEYCNKKLLTYYQHTTSTKKVVIFQ